MTVPSSRLIYCYYYYHHYHSKKSMVVEGVVEVVGVPSFLHLYIIRRDNDIH